ncbi:MAG: hypothetical protein M3O09_03465 [Acidobacteriota bacterium]|nr:hypothetical protein [Acidobacteriota bacterium]
MKRFFLLAITLILLAAISALAAPNSSSTKAPVFPRALANARHVYVASYEGDEFNMNLLSEDRTAISAVRGAIQDWGRLNIACTVLRKQTSLFS